MAGLVLEGFGGQETQLRDALRVNGPQGTIIVCASVDEEGFPVLDIRFNPNFSKLSPMMFEVKDKDPLGMQFLGLQSQLCVTLGERPDATSTVS